MKKVRNNGFYKAWNKPEKAQEWQAKLPKTEAKIE
jgi:hypothetical protein